MMHHSCILRNAMRIFVYITVASLIVISLCGFRNDITSARGDKCKFQARIIAIETPPSGEKLLVVKKIPVKMANTEIYVFLTDDTIIGSIHNIMNFNDLAEDMRIEIQGRMVITQENDHELIDVYAQRIRPLVE